MLKLKSSSYFKDRRHALMKCSPEAAFLFIGKQVEYRNPDVNYPFRQESNFQYLTDYQEEDAALLLVNGKSYLFVQPRDQIHEIWTGERYGKDRAKSIFGFDDTFEFEDFDKKFVALTAEAKVLYYGIGNDQIWDQRVLGHLAEIKRRTGRSGLGLLPVHDPNEHLGEMRLFKSEEELLELRKAAKISARGHIEAMKFAKPGLNEHQVQAFLEYNILTQGCKRMGYGSIIAGGANACCLHYTHNNMDLRADDLLLIDAGGEYNYYTADITRTFPISGKFSGPQKEIYQLVLKAQTECVDKAVVGESMESLATHAQRVLADGLVQMGLLSGSVDDLIESGEIKRVYPHGLGHWLGMDVHDVGRYRDGKTPRPYEAGMCFTIEPGLYFQPDDEKIPDMFKGIGVRIEDNVVIQKSGPCEVLTADVPKDMTSLEEICSS